MRNISGDKSLKDVLAEKIPKEQEIVKAFRKSHGSTKVGEVTVDMVSEFEKQTYLYKIITESGSRNVYDSSCYQFMSAN